MFVYAPSAMQDIILCFTSKISFQIHLVWKAEFVLNMHVSRESDCILSNSAALFLLKHVQKPTDLFLWFIAVHSTAVQLKEAIFVIIQKQIYQFS